jgi:hypothetical protein
MADTDRIETDVELLKKETQLLNNISEKFDKAIDKLSIVSSTIERMLAVHENRLEILERQTEIIHDRISDFKKEILAEIKDLKKENEIQHRMVSERLQKLERWRWFVVGASLAIGFVLAQFTNITAIFR